MRQVTLNISVARQLILTLPLSHTSVPVEDSDLDNRSFWGPLPAAYLYIKSSADYIRNVSLLTAYYYPPPTTLHIII